MDIKNSFNMGLPTYLVVVGIGLVWFLANKMELSTLPKKPIQPNDLFEEVTIHKESINYN